MTLKYPLEPLYDRDLSEVSHFSKGVVVFDRDGTLIEDAGQHNDVKQVKFISATISVMGLLNSQNFGIAVASNQAGLESEKFSLLELQNFNSEMNRQIKSTIGSEIHLIAVCPHLSASNCDCRKPKPGLLKAINESGLGQVRLFVGNSDSDREAAEQYCIDYMDVNSKDFSTRMADWASKL
jgi:D-glycero-D-manno-heptose 1,7-bisphosphate phosphatase